jgi:hypothetical protein
LEKNPQPCGKAIALFMRSEERDEQKSSSLLGILQLPDGGSERMPGMGISSRPVLLAGQWNLLSGQGEENMGSEAGVLQKMQNI